MACCSRVLAVLIAVLPFPVAARELDVRVTDARGAPVADAVVTAVPRANYTSLPAVPAPKTHVIDQKNETFIPYIEVFRPGDSVVFQFVLAPGESSTPLPLTQTGVIAVGCNIHDQMITYFFVTDAPFVARSDAEGRARIELPPGSFDVRVWHPRQRPGGPDNTQAFTAAPDAAPADLAYTLMLLPDQRDAHDRERSGY
jgi:hypothetical protein